MKDVNEDEEEMSWIYYFFPEGNPLGIWINMNEDEENDVVDSTKDDEEMSWISFSFLKENLNEDWWNILCIFFVEDGWKIC